MFKKGFILTATLLVLSVFVLVFGTIVIDKPKENLEIEETVLFGDIVAAENISISGTLDFRGHLLWNTSVTPGQAKKAETKFTLVSDAQEKDYPSEPGAFLDARWFFTLSPDLVTEDASIAPLIAPAREIADRTTPGTTKKETVFLKDYYDVYPISLHVSWEDNTYYEVSDDDVSKLFAFPIEPDATVSISIEKDTAGNVISAHIVSESTSTWDTPNAQFFGDTLYFSIQQYPLYAGEDFVDDNFQGVWRVDREKKDQFYEYTLVGEVYTDERIDRILAFEKTPNREDRLALLTAEGTKTVLSILSVPEMEVLQRLEFSPEKDEMNMDYMEMQDGYMLLKDYDGAFILFDEQQDGTYQQKIRNTFRQFETNTETQRNYAFDVTSVYNGERFAALWECSANKIQLHIYDKTGLIYASRFANSLDELPCGSENLAHDPNNMEYWPSDMPFEQAMEQFQPKAVYLSDMTVSFA